MKTSHQTRNRLLNHRVAGGLLATSLLFFSLTGIAANQAGALINVDFGQDAGPSGKTGAAAVGQATNDFWNFYSRDGAGGWQTFGVLSNLKLADGTMTLAGLTVANAPGSWGMSSTDAMYRGYLYPFSGVATVTVTNLTAGEYELYVYAHDGNYQLTVGTTDHGVKTCRDAEYAGGPVWQEGRQYVCFTGVSVAAGESLTLTVQAGLDGYAIIAGMQLVYVAAPPPPPAAFLVNVDFGAGTGPSAKSGPAVVGQQGNDFWNHYTRDDGAGGWRTFGAVPDLKLANGTATSAGLTVANAPGAWGTSSADPMYANYIYPFANTATVTVTNLPAGEYDLYLYAPDSKYAVAAGGVSYGVQTNVDPVATGMPVWQEGVQYAHFSGVIVSNHQALVITVQPGIHGYATLSGLQIVGSTTIVSNLTPPTIVEHPVSQTVYLGASVLLSTSVSGTDPLAYQWRFNGTNLHGATNDSYAIDNVQLSHAGHYSVVVTNAAGLAISSNAALAVVQSVSNNLINVDFGQDAGPSGKIGAAAVGQATNDFWNFYSRDGAGGWQTFGGLSNLKLSDGTMTLAGLTVANAPGSWGMSSTDAMYRGYLYPFSGVATITVTNLIAGEYELYVYAHDGNYQLTVGTTDYGVQTCRDGEYVGTPVWQEGRQYVRFAGVSVAAGEPLTLTVQAGLDGYAIIAGMQLVYAAAPPPPPAAFLVNVDFGAGAGPSAKSGPAAIGQEANDFWNHYTRDDGAGGWRTFGAVSDLKLANGTATSAGLTVANAPGAWGTSSADPMYANYIYPFENTATVTLTNLPFGRYDLYLYAPDSKYEVAAGGLSYGVRTNVDQVAMGTPVWQEGVQYAHFSGVVVSNSQAVVITVQPGINGYATLSGLQIVESLAAGGTNQNPCGLISLSCPEGQCLKVRFAGVPANRYRVQASTNLVTWVELGCAIADNAGNCEFVDKDSPNFPRRYYRIVLP